MIRNRSELDKKLLEDWIAKKENSFIYGYIREGMDESARILAERIAEGSSTDDASDGKNRYIRLKAIDIAFNDMNAITYEQYTEMLIAYRDSCGDKATGKFKNFEDRDSIRKNVDSLLDYFLRNAVSEYFRAQGYSIKKEKDTSTDTVVERIETKSKQRKNLDPVSLYLAYSESIGISGSKNAGAGQESRIQDADIMTRIKDESYFMECLKVLATYQKQQEAGAFLPLYIDERTGAGIYVIGKKHMHDRKKLQLSCYPCIVAFKEVLDPKTYTELSSYKFDSVEDDIREWMDPNAYVNIDSILLPDGKNGIGYSCLFTEKIIVRYENLSVAREVFLRLIRDGRTYNVYKDYNEYSDTDSDMPEDFIDYMYIPDGDLTEDEQESIRNAKAKEDKYMKGKLTKERRHHSGKRQGPGVI